MDTTTPSSSHSMDTTALSVWMSHNTSPAEMASPSSLYHLTMVPSVMVGDKLGMFTTVPGVEPPAAAAGGAGAAASAGASPPATTVFQSSPSSATTAINSPTLMAPESALFNILARTPSSSASMDTTALSVWMSHTTSPASMASPSAFIHLTMVPSSMVGDRLGILIWMADATLLKCKALVWSLPRPARLTCATLNMTLL